MARRMGGRLINTSAIDLMTRELLIGKNRRATQKARHPKDFCLSITPAAFERKLGRGWNLLRPGVHLWAAACALLEIGVARADFTSSDSQVLAGMGADIDDISGNAARIEGILSSIQTAWDNSIPDMANDLADISSYAEWCYNRLGTVNSHLSTISGSVGGIASALSSHAAANDSNLRDLRDSNNAISRSLSSIYDLISTWSFPSNSASSVVSVTNIVDLSSFVGVISNAIASTPSVNVSVTNFLTSSGEVDMTMVTNNTVLSQFFARWLFDHYDYNDYPSLYEFFKAYYGTENVSRGALVDMLAASSSVGLPLALIWSALPSSEPYYKGNLFSASADFWLGDYESDNGDISMVLGSPYSIFDAYNTLPLGTATNQLLSIYKTLQGWNNFDFHAKVAISNTLNAILAKLDGDITINQSPQSVSTSIAVTNILENALGSSDEVDLDYEVEHEMPEWIPSYQEAAAVYTNDESYFDVSRNLTTSMYDGKTNSLGTIYAAFDRDAVRLNERLSFGGINPGHGHGYLGSWSFRIGFQESSSAYHELKRVCRGVYNVIIFVAHLCVFFIFSRRIVKFVTKPFPV